MLSCFYLRFFINIGMVHKTLLSPLFSLRSLLKVDKFFFWYFVFYTTGGNKISTSPSLHLGTFIFTNNSSFFAAASAMAFNSTSESLVGLAWWIRSDFVVHLFCVGKKRKKREETLTNRFLKRSAYHSTNKPHGPLTRHERSRERLANCSNLCGFVEFFSMFLGSVYVFLTQWPCSCTNSKKQST